MKFRNAGEAFVSKLGEIAATGECVTVRGHLTRELRNQTITLQEPLERCIAVPGRRNNTFAAIAETMWVVAGRDDLSYLSAYLPRARDFSDDGTTWRAAYGPRLRSWHGIDQLEHVRKLLGASPESRRAVMSIFDPATDFSDSKDVPCTNWLHFRLRDNKLDLNVVVRSNDLIWGFSGINTFEWSVLQEMMAHWVGASVGEATYFVSSLHLYQRHFGRAGQILSQAHRSSPYRDVSTVQRFNTPFDELSTRLSEWFALEARMRTGTINVADITKFQDPLLRDFLAMLNAYWTFRRGAQVEARALLDSVQDPALAFAGRDYFDWMMNPASERTTTDIELSPPGFTVLLGFLTELHRVKDAMYGDSWKRRGEQMGILANVARKVDRLVMYTPSAPEGTESFLDSAVDLLIYSVKYDTYLSDMLGLRPPADKAWSDGTAGFEETLKAVQPLVGEEVSASERTRTIAEVFHELEEAVAVGSSAAEKAGRVKALSDQAAALVMALCRENPASVYRMMSELDYASAAHRA
ncbi:thymidylate synthase [Arthrobacter sp. Z4-13]